MKTVFFFKKYVSLTQPNRVKCINITQSYNDNWVLWLTACVSAVEVFLYSCPVPLGQIKLKRERKRLNVSGVSAPKVPLKVC